MDNNKMPIKEKYMLSINEASEYFNIGTKSLRQLANDNIGKFAIRMGCRILICRERFEEYLSFLMDGEGEE